MISTRAPLSARVGATLAVLALLATLLAAVASCGCAPCGPWLSPVRPAPSWDEYVERHPQYRDLSPDADHPGWRGRGGQVCGAGKCG